ncbi:MAG TPA: hypothetical protein VNW92_02955 [Polyangiaceae bacterium]|jgi:hypothetical protein|nr:hypothetical protein [Polyangiaceae bacterium]
MVVSTCALLLVLIQDRLAEFTLGPKGASAKLIRLEEVVSDQGKLLQDQQSLINSLVKYWMSASAFHPRAAAIRNRLLLKPPVSTLTRSSEPLKKSSA